MPTVPSDPFGPWLRWQATNHILERCDASSGHAVAPIAFCDNVGRAAFIARACNAHDTMREQLGAAYRLLGQVIGEGFFDWGEAQAIRAALAVAEGRS